MRAERESLTGERGSWRTMTETLFTCSSKCPSFDPPSFASETDVIFCYQFRAITPPMHTDMYSCSTMQGEL